MTRIVEEAGYFHKLPDFRWSLERYHAAIAAGVLTENDKVELLFGKLVPMSPVGVMHSKIVKKVLRLFTKRFPEETFTIGVQDPITLIDDSEPEPDLHIAKGNLETYDHHPYPEDLLLVVEVSDSTLDRDRNIKKLNYAIAGIQEYWIINVYERRVERFSNPNADNGTYTDEEIFQQGESFESLFLGSFEVNNLLIID